MSPIPLLLLLGVACGDEDRDSAGPDGGAADGGAADGGAADGGAADGGAADGGGADGGGTGDGGDTGEDCPDPQDWTYDADGDGYGDATLVVSACEAPPGYVPVAGDCDDLDDEVHPGAVEACGNGRDEDCLGGDEACPLPLGGDLDKVAWSAEGLSQDEDVARPLAVGDLDGDGQDDLLLADPRAHGGQGMAWLHAGPLAEDRTLADATAVVDFLDSQADLPALGTAARLGDLDGDGYLDLLLGAPDRFEGGGLGGGWILPGPLAGAVDPVDAGDFLAPATIDQRVGRAAALGDLDGDGQLDLVLASTEPGMPAWVVPGPVLGGSLPALGHRVEQAEPDRQAGRALVADADLDGDGLADLVLGQPSDDSGGVAGTVRLLRGPVDGDRAAGDADAVLDGALADDRFGWALGAGDVDGDGRADLVVGAPTSGVDGTYAGHVYGFTDPLGAPTAAAADAPVQLPGTGAGFFAGGALALADLDGDGALDLAGFTMDLDMDGSQAWLLPGPLVDGTPLDAGVRTWTSSDAGVLTGWWLLAEGDPSGDGRVDLVVGQWDPGGTGRAFLPMPGG